MRTVISVPSILAAPGSSYASTPSPPPYAAPAPNATKKSEPSPLGDGQLRACAVQLAPDSPSAEGQATATGFCPSPPPAGGRPGPSAGGGRLALFVAGPCPGRRGARGARAGVFAMRGAAAGTIRIQHPKPALVADECVEVHLLPLTVACISSVRQLPHEPTPERNRRGAPGRPPWRKAGWARRRPACPTRSHRGSARGHAAHTRQGRLDRPRVEEATG